MFYRLVLPVRTPSFLVTINDAFWMELRWEPLSALLPSGRAVVGILLSGAASFEAFLAVANDGDLDAVSWAGPCHVGHVVDDASRHSLSKRHDEQAGCVAEHVFR